jgi:hypothetical protein
MVTSHYWQGILGVCVDKEEYLDFGVARVWGVPGVPPRHRPLHIKRDSFESLGCAVLCCVLPSGIARCLCSWWYWSVPIGWRDCIAYIVSPDRWACHQIGAHRLVMDRCIASPDWIGRDIGRNRALLFSGAIRWFYSMMWKRLLCCIWGEKAENRCARLAAVTFEWVERISGMASFRSYIHISVYSDISLKRGRSCLVFCHVLSRQYFFVYRLAWFLLMLVYFFMKIFYWHYRLLCYLEASVLG